MSLQDLFHTQVIYCYLTIWKFIPDGLTRSKQDSTEIDSRFENWWTVNWLVCSFLTFLVFFLILRYGASSKNLQKSTLSFIWLKTLFLLAYEEYFCTNSIYRWSTFTRNRIALLKDEGPIFWPSRSTNTQVF